MLGHDAGFFFTAERLERMRRESYDGLEHCGGRVRVSRIMSILGRWMLLSAVIPGLVAYLRSGFWCVRGRIAGGIMWVCPARFAWI